MNNNNNNRLRHIMNVFCSVLIGWLAMVSTVDAQPVTFVFSGTVTEPSDTILPAGSLITGNITLDDQAEPTCGSGTCYPILEATATLPQDLGDLDWDGINGRMQVINDHFGTIDIIFVDPVFLDTIGVPIVIIIQASGPSTTLSSEALPTESFPVSEIDTILIEFPVSGPLGYCVPPSISCIATASLDVLDRVNPPVIGEGAAISILNISGSGGSVVSATQGWDFEALEPISITHLGVFDHNSDGLNEAHEVGLWRIDGAVTTLLASATVPAGTSAELVDDFRYVPIPPLILEPFVPHVMGAFYESPFSDPNNDRVVFPVPSEFLVDSRIHVDAEAGRTRGSSQLVLPFSSNLEPLLGPNFLLEDPSGPVSFWDFGSVIFLEPVNSLQVVGFGSVEFLPVPGQGTEFFIEIPVDFAERAAHGFSIFATDLSGQLTLSLPEGVGFDGMSFSVLFFGWTPEQVLTNPELFFNDPQVRDILAIPFPPMGTGDTVPFDIFRFDHTSELAEAFGSGSVVGVVDNQPPTANAGINQTLECTDVAGSNVTLDGSGSNDPDGDPLSYSWTGAFGTLTGESVQVTLPLGMHTITLSVDDGNGGTDSDTVDVTVQDTVAPDLDLSVSPDTLWPPNHKLVPITTTVSATDTCDSNPVVSLSSITMNESNETNTFDPSIDSTVGDGNTTDDIVVANGSISLRAERQGGGNGRIYTIIYTATDGSGNTRNETATVTVPHDQ